MLDKMEAAIENIDKMPQSTFDEIIEKYVEVNIAPLQGRKLWNAVIIMKGM